MQEFQLVIENREILTEHLLESLDLQQDRAQVGLQAQTKVCGRGLQRRGSIWVVYGWRVAAAGVEILFCPALKLGSQHPSQ